MDRLKDGLDRIGILEAGLVGRKVVDCHQVTYM